MKKLLTLFVILFSVTYTQAQDYLGLSTGNFAGLQGIMLQPANAADNRYKFEINLASTNIGFQNNYLGLSRSYFLKNRFSFKDFNSYQDFKNQVLQENAIKGNNVQLNLSNRTLLPSLFVTTGKKSGIAVTFQSRTAIAVDNMNPAFAKQLYEEWNNSATYGQSYNVTGLDITALNWFEGGVTYGRVLLDNGKHFIKAGVTAKYLGGVSSWYLKADDLGITANNDSTLSLSGNRVNYGHSESNISAGSLKNYTPDASGLGFDAGIVYEFRGRIDQFKFLKFNKKDTELYTTTRRDKNKYSIKAGVSLLDAGKLTFNSTPLARDFSANVNGINIKNIGIKNVQDLDTFISQNVNYLSAQTGQQYTVAMPTALSAQLDVHLYRGFYINGMAYMPFKSLNKKTDYRVFTPNYYAVTPRWESRVAGLYVPLVYNNNNNEDKDFTIGATLRVGPLFVGSSNLLTLLKKDNIQAADAHVGFKIPIAHGKPSKAATWFKKFTNEKETSSTTEETAPSTEIIEKTKESEKTIEKTIEKEVETAPNNRPIQIIINNYNGTDAKNRQRIIDVDPATGKTMERTVIINDAENKAAKEEMEMNNLQEQIEFLKFKLKQKENLINELEKEQERINNGNSTEESKKKIDSLKDEYLYNKNFDYETVPKNTATTIEEQAAQVFELKKELLNLDSRNGALDKKVARLSQQNVEQVEGNATSRAQKELLAEVKTLINLIQKEEANALRPATAYTHLAPDYTPIVKQNTKEKVGGGAQSKQSTEKKYASDNQNALSKSDLNNLADKADYENLRNEIRALRTELQGFKNAESQLAKKTTTVPVPVVIPAPRTMDTKIVRDTIYIEKPVETVVTKIVRDTITNTIERNNVVTETKFKEVEVTVDNSEAYLLGLPPYFVLFNTGSTDITSIYKGRLDYYAKQLKEKPNLRIALTGHADATGNAARNLELSQQRANSVRTYLVNKGVTNDKISIDFAGDKNPLETNETKVGKSQNRRVEVLFVK